MWSEQVPVQDDDRGSGGLLMVFVRETSSRKIETDSYPFLTPTARSLQCWDRRVMPRLV